MNHKQPQVPSLAINKTVTISNGEMMTAKKKSTKKITGKSELKPECSSDGQTCEGTEQSTARDAKRDRNPEKTDCATYMIQMACQNCDYAGSVHIPKGTPVAVCAGKVPCPKCGCTHLRRAEKSQSLPQHMWPHRVILGGGDGLMSGFEEQQHRHCTISPAELRARTMMADAINAFERSTR